jgi:outer membrane protein assembly factor BamB
MNFAVFFFNDKRLIVFRSVIILFFIVSYSKVFCQEATQKDWPQFRSDSQRSAATSLKLPDQMHLKWMREFKPLEPVWPDDTRIQFDKNYHPIVIGKSLFLASPVNDCLISIATETGEIQWKFFADAPIRFAPASRKGKLYCVSDDGYLYCLDASSGKLLWKFRGAPNDSKILVSGRLASPWPARGAPAVDENNVYFSAGIWPFMGIFIYALDCETGKVVWVNSGSGSNYITQTHDSKAFTGRPHKGI